MLAVISSNNIFRDCCVVYNNQITLQQWTLKNCEVIIQSSSAERRSGSGAKIQNASGVEALDSNSHLKVKKH